MSKVQDAFDDDGHAVEAAYERRIGNFLDEFEWYANALKAAREWERRAACLPMQQGLCQGSG